MNNGWWSLVMMIVFYISILGLKRNDKKSKKSWEQIKKNNGIYVFLFIMVSSILLQKLGYPELIKCIF